MEAGIKDAEEADAADAVGPIATTKQLPVLNTESSQKSFALLVDSSTQAHSKEPTTENGEEISGNYLPISQHFEVNSHKTTQSFNNEATSDNGREVSGNYLETAQHSKQKSRQTLSKDGISDNGRKVAGNYLEIPQYADQKTTQTQGVEGTLDNGRDVAQHFETLSKKATIENEEAIPDNYFEIPQHFEVKEHQSTVSPSKGVTSESVRRVSLNYLEIPQNSQVNKPKTPANFEQTEEAEELIIVIPAEPKVHILKTEFQPKNAMNEKNEPKRDILYESSQRHKTNKEPQLFAKLETPTVTELSWEQMENELEQDFSSNIEEEFNRIRQSYERKDDSNLQLKVQQELQELKAQPLEDVTELKAVSMPSGYGKSIEEDWHNFESLQGLSQAARQLLTDIEEPQFEQIRDIEMESLKAPTKEHFDAMPKVEYDLPDFAQEPLKIKTSTLKIITYTDLELPRQTKEQRPPPPAYDELEPRYQAAQYVRGQLNVQQSFQQQKPERPSGKPHATTSKVTFNYNTEEYYLPHEMPYDSEDDDDAANDDYQDAEAPPIVTTPLPQQRITTKTSETNNSIATNRSLPVEPPKPAARKFIGLPKNNSKLTYSDA